MPLGPHGLEMLSTALAYFVFQRLWYLTGYKFRYVPSFEMNTQKNLLLLILLLTKVTRQGWRNQGGQGVTVPSAEVRLSQTARSNQGQEHCPHQFFVPFTDPARVCQYSAKTNLFST